MRRQLLIDTDTASDDAVALIMALRHVDVSVLGITVVAGNCQLEQAISNALYTAELCGSNVPVFAGARAPLERPLQVADWFHGKDGLGDHGFKPKNKRAESEHAVDAFIRLVEANPGIDLVTLGPLTNVALALRRQPSLIHKISRCVVMGGAPCCEGNVTPAAEFNIWVDPEAARAVFLSGLPIEMIGWQLCRGQAVLNETEIKALQALSSPFADFAVQSNTTAAQALRTQTGELGICLPDPVAMGIYLWPELCLHSSLHFVEVETASELTRGMTVVDRLNVSADSRNHVHWKEAHRKPALKIGWQLDIQNWKHRLFEMLR